MLSAYATWRSRQPELPVVQTKPTSPRARVNEPGTHLDLRLRLVDVPLVAVPEAGLAASAAVWMNSWPFELELAAAPRFLPKDVDAGPLSGWFCGSLRLVDARVLAPALLPLPMSLLLRWSIYPSIDSLST